MMHLLRVISTDWRKHVSFVVGGGGGECCIVVGVEHTTKEYIFLQYLLT